MARADASLGPGPRVPMAGFEGPSVAQRGSYTFGCGESEFLMTHATMLASCHLWAKCMCRWANMDLSIGATGLIADDSGLEHTPHIQDCMSEAAMDAEVLYSCAVAASEFAGWGHAMCVSGGGAVQTFKGMVAMESDFERCKGKARLAAGIDE